MRNFLYNKSDILIAVIIIAVAAIIIWTRIGAIMGSSGDTGKVATPAGISSQEADTPEGVETADNGTTAPPAGDSNTPDTQATGTDPATTATTNAGITTDSAAGTTDGTGDAASEETIKFTIELGASSGSVAEDLETQGIIKAADFIKEIKAQDKEGSIKVGTFKLKASMTPAQIVKKVTN
jgi:hypothetical protein